MRIEDIPTWPQRQDSLSDQFADLRIIANKLGFYDCADAIGQWITNMPELKYGCHCDLEPNEIATDDCVLGIDRLSCSQAAKITRKEQCEYWRPV